jgi:hypothetical protein
VSVPRLHRRPGARVPLEELLASSHFRLGPHTARVAKNLELHGGVADEGAVAWIGADLPPLGAPSVSLGEARGTLGPHSFGFLDNQRGVAPLAAPLLVRPRLGPVALVCARREALVDVGPLAVAHDLGVSWILSVGDGDPEEALEFLGRDAATRAVLLSPGAGARPGMLGVLGDKPVAVLGGEPLLRAAVRRRAGSLSTEDVEEWLAFGLLAETEVGTPRRVLALVAGGGAAQITQMARTARLDLRVVPVDDDEPEELEAAVRRAAEETDLLLVAGIQRAALPHTERPVLSLDVTAPERVRALLTVLAGRCAPVAPPLPQVRADRKRAQAIVAEAGGVLGDHDTKRVLNVYGVRVSRQAPASSHTAALRVAQQVGFPVDVVVPPEARRDADGLRKGTSEALVRRAAAAPDLRRAAGILLEEATFVLVREAFAETPRARLAVRHESGLGLVAHIGEERAVLPLDRADVSCLARAAAGGEGQALLDFLVRIAVATEELNLELDLEMYVGDEPVVLSASARRR